MARPGNLEPTANGAEQDARWKRKASERVNYLLEMIEALTARIKALEDAAP